MNDPAPAPRPFAADQSKNPPPKNTLDRVLRRFARASYFVCGAAALRPGVDRPRPGPRAGALVLRPRGALERVVARAPPLVRPRDQCRPVLLRGRAGPARRGPGLQLDPAHPDPPFKGGYYSIYTIPWFLHNGLFYLVRYTFLPFVTLTPFGIWFLKAMGMTIGRHAFVNTEYISDPALITLGDDAALGGSVRIFAHYGGGGSFVVAPVVIERRATIGLGATVMGDVEVGEGATVLPHSVLLPGSRVGAGETWGGVPARRIPREEMERFKEGIRGARTVELP